VGVHEVENSLLQVVNHVDVDCTEEGGVGEVTQDTWNMLKHHLF
jgi:hypothetical protein